MKHKKTGTVPDQNCECLLTITSKRCTLANG